MCGHAFGGEEDQLYVGGFYQVYPTDERFPGLSENWETFSEENLIRVFPDKLEAYCVLVFLTSAFGEGRWSGMTYHYIDRMFVLSRRMQSRSAWRRIGQWMLGQRSISRSDVFSIFYYSSVGMFWGSMRSLVLKEYVSVEKKEIEGIEVDVFFPSKRLINKILCSL
jgi:hypothetical protein